MIEIECSLKDLFQDNESPNLNDLKNKHISFNSKSYKIFLLSVNTDYIDFLGCEPQILDIRVRVQLRENICSKKS